MVHASPKYSQLNVLFEKVFSSQATSAPVERVFSSSGLLMRPHHARVTNYIIIRVVYLTCMTRQDKNLL